MAKKRKEKAIEAAGGSAGFDSAKPKKQKKGTANVSAAGGSAVSDSGEAEAKPKKEKKGTVNVSAAGGSAGSDFGKAEAKPKKRKEQEEEKGKGIVLAAGASSGEAEEKPKKRKKRKEKEEEKDGSKLPDVSWLFDDIDNHKEFFERLLPDCTETELTGLIDLKLRNFKVYRNIPETSYISSRVRHMSNNLHLIKSARQLHQRIIEPFEGLSPQQALDRLSNPSDSMKLPLPSMKSRESPSNIFTYMGRREFPLLLQMVKLERYVNFTGHSGRGKSYLVAAMACYLHTYKTECGVVVYILMSKLVGDFDYLLEALLLAYVRDPTKQLELLAYSNSEKELLDFLQHMDDDDEPLFLIDEVNVLDNSTERAGSTPEQRGIARKWRESFYGRGLSCFSDNANFQTMRLKDGIPVQLTRPFDIDELSGWISANGHSKESLGDFDDLINHTGLIPRHLGVYVRDKNDFKQVMEFRMEKFIDHIRDKEDTEDLVRRVLDGDLPKIENLVLDHYLFYERPFGSGTIVTVLPFLDTKLRAHMDMRRVQADIGKQINNFARRRVIFRGIMYDQTDQTDKGLQSVGSLNGWLVERLTRDYMLLYSKCLGWKFASSATYVDGGTVTDLDLLSAEKLQSGVLFLPSSTNAKYADLHHVQKDGNTLKVRAVQISVSTLSKKTYKDSHNLWKENSEQYWTRHGCTTKATYTYILSNALRRDFGDVKAAFMEVKRFVDVDPSLEFIDNLRDPECELQQCKGMTKENVRCSNVKIQEGPYFCHHHQSQ